MKKKIVSLGMLAALLTFGLMLTGCLFGGPDEMTIEITGVTGSGFEEGAEVELKLLYHRKQSGGEFAPFGSIWDSGKATVKDGKLSWSLEKRSGKYFVGLNSLYSPYHDFKSDKESFNFSEFTRSEPPRPGN